MNEQEEWDDVAHGPMRVAAFCLSVARKLDEIRAAAPSHVVLEVAASAAPADVRAAYRRLAKAFHPDTNRELIAEVPGIEQDLDELLFGLSVARRDLIGHSGPLGTTAEVRTPLPTKRPPQTRPAARSGRAPSRYPTGATSPGPTRRNERRDKSASDWYREGRELLAGRDRVGAAACFARARELDPEDAEYCRSIGEALSEVPDRLEEALEPLVEAVRLEPDSGGTWYLLGEVRERIGALAGAREAFCRALALSPSDMRARLAVGRVSAAIRAVPDPDTSWRSRLGRFANG